MLHFFLSKFIVAALMSFAGEATQATNYAAGEPQVINDTVPFTQDLYVKEREILPGNPWGKVILTSIPKDAAGNEIKSNEGEVKKLTVSISVICKSGGEQKIVLPATDICKYQNAEYNTNLSNAENFINVWDFNPERNIKVSGDNSSIFIYVRPQGRCGSETTFVKFVQCPKATPQRPGHI